MLIWCNVRTYPLMRGEGTVKIDVFRKGFYTDPSTTNNKNNPPNWLNETVEMEGFQQLSA